MSANKIDFNKALTSEETLDPENWDQLKSLGHEMVDTMMDYLRHLRDQPVWKKPTREARHSFNRAMPTEPQNREDVFQDFLQHVLPFAKGNVHPKFWGWVEGNGTPFGMLADMLASGMNSNLGIGDHAAVYVELQVLNWIKEFLGFPMDASGILVSGGSMANFTGLAVAKDSIPDRDIRVKGLFESPSRLTVYGSTETHNSVQKAIETLGLGSQSFIRIPVDKNYQIDMKLLREAIDKDRKRGRIPFCIVGNAGTVNTGSIDPLAQLAVLAKKENMWFHVDGAFGAFAAVVDELKDEIKGLQEADSVAFDLHKWMYMPYEAGCVLVRDKKLHRKSFHIAAPYLISHERGLPAGPESFGDYGMQLSKGFTALKVWMSLKEHGTEKYKRIIRQNIAQAAYLEQLVNQSPELELMAPVALNIVCFRYMHEDLSNEELNTLNKEILMTLHEEGRAITTYTMLGDAYVLRVANVNHRSRKEDFMQLVHDVIEIGNGLLADGFKRDRIIKRVI